jgi:hypothetical protein
MVALTSDDRDYALRLSRAFGGAILFGLSLLMSMEMWSLGVTNHAWRQLLFLALNFWVLVMLSRFGAFEPTSCLSENLLDALAAYAVAIAASACVLALFGLIRFHTPVMSGWAGSRSSRFRRVLGRCLRASNSVTATAGTMNISRRGPRAMAANYF